MPIDPASTDTTTEALPQSFATLYELPAVFPLLLAVATDSAADAAIRLTRQLSQTRGAVPSVLHVSHRPPDPLADGAPNIAGVHADALLPEYRDGALSAIESQLQHALGAMPPWHIELTSGDAIAAIVQQARHVDAALIVLGLPPHTLRWRASVRDTVQGVVSETQVPVLAVHPTLEALPTRVMVAVDFSAASLRAASLARQIVAPDGHIQLVYVNPNPGLSAHESATKRRQRDVGLDAALSLLIEDLKPAGLVTVTTVICDGEGDVAEQLRRQAESFSPDLIALGSVHHTAADWFFGDSVTTHFTAARPCSLLLVPDTHPIY